MKLSVFALLAIVGAAAIPLEREFEVLIKSEMHAWATNSENAAALARRAGSFLETNPLPWALYT